MTPCSKFRRLPQTFQRRGKILLVIAVCLPALFAVVGLTVNTATMQDQRLDLQHAADAAALAAIAEIYRGGDQARQAANAILLENGVSETAQVTVNIPPLSGHYAGRADHVEVIVSEEHPLTFARILQSSAPQISVRAVAGMRSETSEVAVQILDPSPSPLSIPPVPGIIPALPALLGGLEVEGLGSVKVNGAVVVNNEWGGVNEKGLLVGQLPELPGLQHSISCTPLLPLTSLKAEDIYVCGGVDALQNYDYLADQAGNPVKANRSPVPDPFSDLPVPTISADAANVSAELKGGVNILSLPLLLPPVKLRPGVYDYINVISGRIQFEPGVYIVRGVNPLTGIAVQILTGDVKAEGVMFYITNSAGFTPASGNPDKMDGETEPAVPGVVSVLPSVVINAGLLNSNYTGLDSPGSPFDGMLIYQRRADRRPIVLVKENLLGNSTLEGTIYAKWGHLILVGKGTFKTSLVAGTARILPIAEIQIQPDQKLPAAKTVSLVE